MRSAFALRIISGKIILNFGFGVTAFAERSVAMKAPVGLLSGRAVCVSRWRGFAPTSSADFPDLQIINNFSADDVPQPDSCAHSNRFIPHQK